MSSTHQSKSRDQIQTWLEGFHRGSAELDAEKWCSTFMTDDIELQYANNPVLKGAEVRAMFASVFRQLSLMKHKVVYFDFVPPRIYQAARIRYRVVGDPADGSQDIEIPGFATFFVREGEDGELKCYRAETFLDPSQVFARIAQKTAGDRP
ncbi:uncharacterized protein Z520_05492 [Fonsecaea multimorphosa CBS 102226]|uniref:SnoaL-like domain-containing protein n=1 Tax=Fonsecaea multimorphosa CBS 102226 TaxID=1442371 RepID=A0A0D2IQ11_9EURO|nr:uncharacterized protein Z520_05492 [Fonsecaea multimorphosa CBS 102226]KIX99031.1 hypothetical protein Z520_05492 [Fonsecaea multimorphosa CBS 102226]OAL25298.1 hypothetical protein AYO22_05175 [Fonsecaea multimorphosa]